MISKKKEEEKKKSKEGRVKLFKKLRFPSLGFIKKRFDT